MYQAVMWETKEGREVEMPEIPTIKLTDAHDEV